MIDDILEFSRLSRQRGPLTTIGLGTVMLSVRNELIHQLEAKRVDLRVEKLPMVACDRTAIFEVFHNLVSNAIKYNDKDFPVIEIGCEEKVNPESGAGEFEFYVRDNGIGIDPRYHNKVFEIFERLQEDEEGTGIGLTIVKRVVEWHGGRIWVESERGKGTTFRFTLPKQKETGAPGTVTTTATAAQTTRNTGGSVAPNA
jgi:signal transduction histidine kinase